MADFKKSRKAYLFLLLLGCADVYAARDDVLVVVNDNSADSKQIGAYYAAKRDINPARVVHIKVPNQFYISWVEFQSLRDQILRYGICPAIEVARRPPACSDAALPIYTADNIAALTAATTIRYVVTTRGVPSRMTVTGSTLYSPGESTSVDNYLRFWLARYLTADVNFYSFNERAKAFGNGSGMRIVAPAVDAEYVIGRIDGLDTISANALVDRAIAVESNGLYGRIFGSNYGSTGGQSIWFNYATMTPVYGDYTTGWRYTFGLLGESRPECSDYQSSSHYFAFDQNSTNGKSPSHCLAQFTKGVPNENIQGLSSSRSPRPTDALAYFGSLDGFTVAGGFNTLLNWRKDDTCQVTLCANAADPAGCRLASTDPHREINTACVGVADGFVGYNFQSYPVSIFGTWPTGWGPYSVDQNDPVVIRDNNAVDGSASAWFVQLDEEISPTCYSYANGNFDGTLKPCAGKRKIGLMQTISSSSTDPANPPGYQLAFQLKGQTVQTPATVTNFVRFVYPKTSGTACPSGLSGQTTDTSCQYNSVLSTSLPSGDSGWTLVQRDIRPPINTGLNYTSVVIGFYGTVTGGGAGIDAVSFRKAGDATQLVVNGSFEQGHLQTGNGDYAVNFLSRLGGTAFWGSMSHHESGGHSFELTSMSTMVYLLRGLPLGDAVWLGEPHVSGVFYGDPLYSPMAVQLKYSQANPAQWNFVTGTVNLSGSAVNGSDVTRVATQYRIDYCRGNDFYVCGTAANPWVATGFAGTGGQRDINFGSWNTSLVSPGPYVLRLQVTSSNAAKGKTQSFYDYATVTVYNSTSDADNDGITDRVEMAGTYGTDPLKTDTDNDGLSDGEEVNTYHTDPLKPDSDADGLNDGDEVRKYNSNPLNVDTDGDGYRDNTEVYYGGNPADAQVVPLVVTSSPITTAEADVTYSYQVKSTWTNVTYTIEYTDATGMSINPSTGLITWKPDISLAGNTYYVFARVTANNVTNWQYFTVTVNAINDGDVNGDGVIDGADTLLAQQIALGIGTSTERQRARADVVHDQVIDIADVLKIQRKALGLE